MLNDVLAATIENRLFAAKKGKSKKYHNVGELSENSGPQRV